jgi:hypothetical protein
LLAWREIRMSRRIDGTAATLAVALFVATTADAQPINRRPREQPERAPAAAGKYDSMVAAPGNSFDGKPYWQALGQCGGIYFKLSTLYTDIAVHARAVKPDHKINAEYTKKLNDASRVATVHYVAAERFLTVERRLGRAEAIMTYDAKAREAGSRVSTIEMGIAAAKPCPELYQVCHQAHPKMCTERPASTS